MANLYEDSCCCCTKPLMSVLDIHYPRNTTKHPYCSECKDAVESVKQAGCIDCFWSRYVPVEKRTLCHRYPTEVSTRPAYFCGEWKPRHAS